MKTTMIFNVFLLFQALLLMNLVWAIRLTVVKVVNRPVLALVMVLVALVKVANTVATTWGAISPETVPATPYPPALSARPFLTVQHQ